MAANHEQKQSSQLIVKDPQTGLNEMVAVDPVGPDNPLYWPQREKAGAGTFDRFNYQYDWALYEFLEQSEKKKASIVFVELHEDVVFSSSTDVTEARFIFCQVKAGEGASFNKKSLVRRIKQKPSVLGKMFASVAAKQIADRVDKVRLVATAGFKLEFAQAGFSLEEIPWSALHDQTAADIRTALKVELGADSDVEKLHFHEPDLGLRQHRRTVLGLISDIIGDRSRDGTADGRAIYNLLCDELRRKGTVQWDYSDWESLVLKKGLTTQRVNALFEQFASSASVDELLGDFNSQTEYLKFEPKERRLLRDRARTYVLNTLDGGSLAHLQVRAAICKDLCSAASVNMTHDRLLTLVESCSPSIRSHFVDERSVLAAYLIEYLRAEDGNP